MCPAETHKHTLTKTHSFSWVLGSFLLSQCEHTVRRLGSVIQQFFKNGVNNFKILIDLSFLSVSVLADAEVTGGSLLRFDVIFARLCQLILCLLSVKTIIWLSAWPLWSFVDVCLLQLWVGGFEHSCMLIFNNWFASNGTNNQLTLWTQNPAGGTEKQGFFKLQITAGCSKKISILIFPSFWRSVCHIRQKTLPKSH